MVDVEKLSRKRNAIVSIITKAAKENNDMLNGEIDEKIVNELIIREKIIREKLSKAVELFEEIIEDLDEEQSIIEYDKCYQLDVETNKHLLEIGEIIKKFKNKSQQPPNNKEKSSFKQNVKLPKIEIRKFYGDATEWQQFYDSFSCAVDQNNSLSDVEKMNYLVNLLGGEAALCVKGLQLSNANYLVALNMLKERYGDDQVLISSFMNKLLNLETVPGNNSVVELRGLYDNIETQIRSLNSLGLDERSYGAMLVPVIMAKLPQQVKLIISRKFGKNSWDVKEVLLELKTELEAREKVSLTENTDPNETEEQGMFSGSALFTGSQDVRKSTCIFCKKASHKSSECRTVSNPTARKNIILKERRCLLCLKPGHVIKDCYSKGKCFKCKGKHNISICTGQSKKAETNTQGTQIQNVTSGTQTDDTTACLAGGEHNSVLLQTAKANIVNERNGRQSVVQILFDSGSQLSYVTPAAQSKLELEIAGKQEMCIKTFGGARAVKNLEFVYLPVKTETSIVYVKAFVTEICYPLRDQDVLLAQKKYSHLQGLKLANPCDGNAPFNIDVLIGSDSYWKFIDGKCIKKGSPNEPVAISSNLGFIISGKIPKKSDSIAAMSTHVLKADVDFVNKIEKFWDIESAGVTPQKDVNDKIVEDFERDITFNESSGRYVVKFAMKENHEILGDNFTVSKLRLKNLLSKFKQDRELLASYDKIIRDQLLAGVLEHAPSHSIVGNTCYLPHKAVVKPDRETTKVRIVYDASAKAVGNISLNECLEPGPSLTTKLFQNLLCFRSNNVALSSDVEKSFLQIELHEEQRDLVRMLWFKNINQLDFDDFDNNELVEYRLSRILFGVTSSPFLLTATIIHHMNKFKEVDPDFVTQFLKSLHVDDLNAGAKNDIETLKFFTKSKERLNEASFNLRKVNSNSMTLENLVREHYGDEAVSVNPKLKVLGVNWDKSRDTFNYDFFDIRSKFMEHPTKREALHAIASIYDPLGLINPIVVKFKMFFQKLCYIKLDWDDKIPEDTITEWHELLSGLKNVNTLSFDRNYCFDTEDDPITSVELHGFCDASPKAYGCCVYLKFQLKSGMVKTSLVAGKSRVTPLKLLNFDDDEKKKISMPYLELLGAVLLSYLLVEIRSSLCYDFSRVYAWIDSSAAYAWILNDSVKRPVNVKNRVAEINKNLPRVVWNLIPSKMNPSDLVTKGCSPVYLDGSSLWRYGPHFLTLPKSEWPDLKIGSNFTDACVQSICDVSTNLSAYHKHVNLSEIICLDRHSRLTRLLRVTALVLLFVRKLRSRVRGSFRLDIGDDSQNKTLKNLINGEMVEEAEKMWIHDVQRSMEESGSLEIMEKRYNLFVGEDGLIRCKMRMGKAPIPEQAKFPILLNTEHYFVKLMVLEAHKNVGHMGTSDTLAEIRSRFFIPKGRSFVRRILFACGLCKKHEGKCYPYPPPPDIPESRLKDMSAFHNIGIDLTGPVFVYNIYNQDNEIFKAWIVLITCQSSRAIHLDLATNYTGEACINVLKRFFSRRGTPYLITSDNGSNFIADNVQTFVTNNGVKWRFNLEAAPWTGGFWERLIKSVKRCLRKSLGKRKVNYEEMLTLLIEIERIINNRPLTYVSGDFSSEPLTPNHLIYGRRISKNGGEIEDVIEGSDNVKRLLRHFWNVWSKEYLTELRDRQRKVVDRNRTATPNVGDMVLVSDETNKRIKWRTGRVTDLIRGKDGIARGAIVAVVNKDKIGALRRPLNKLYPFELASEIIDKKNEEVARVNVQMGEPPKLTFIPDPE